MTLQEINSIRMAIRVLSCGIEEWNEELEKASNLITTILDQQEQQLKQASQAIDSTNTDHTFTPTNEN